MELVDLYDENRVPLGKTAERYGKKGPGEYRAVVFMGQCGHIYSRALQQDFIAGLSRHGVHLSFVMVHCMNGPSEIDRKFSAGPLQGCTAAKLRI